MGTEVEVKLDLAVIPCIHCGTPVALPRDFLDALRKTHQTFYCSNGHGMAYSAETEAERLRRELTTVQESNNVLLYNKSVLEGKLNATLEEVGRLTKGARAGLCPYCQKYIPRLRQHIAAKHPRKEE